MLRLLFASAVWLLCGLVSYAATIRDTVWQIHNRAGAAGSGTAVDYKDGWTLLLTCDHLFWAGEGELTAQSPTGDELPARLIRRHPNGGRNCADSNDLALVAVKTDKRPATAAIAASAPARDALCWKVGYPGHGGRQSLDVRTGQIFRCDSVCRGSIYIAPGDSGGGFFDPKGRLCGVCTLAVKSAPNGQFIESRGPGLESVRSFLRAGWS